MAKKDEDTATNVPATQATGQVAVVDDSAYAEYGGAGFENQTSDDYAIPFLQILQALSPQLEDNEQLRQGMIINTVTGEVFPGKEGVVFVPAVTQHQFVEWRPRESGGGFVAVHEVSSPVVKSCQASQDFGNYVTESGNDLIETFYVYGVVIHGDCDSEELSHAVLAFSATKIKKYKAWMTKAKTIQLKLADGRRVPAPLFAHKYRLTTVGEKNNKGSFFNWEIGFAGANAMESRLPPTADAFQAAVAIRELIEEGAARAAYESQSPGSENDQVEREVGEGKAQGKAAF